jgi:hypothetical protein
MRMGWLSLVGGYRDDLCSALSGMVAPFSGGQKFSSDWHMTGEWFERRIPIVMGTYLFVYTMAGCEWVYHGRGWI